MENYRELKHYFQTYSGQPLAYFALEATRRANGCQPLIEKYKDLRVVEGNGHRKEVRELVLV